MEVRVALCQYATELGDKERNLALSLDWIDKASREKPDLILLPELCTTGLLIGERHLDLAEPVPGPTTDSWTKKAKQHSAYIIGGMGMRDPDLPGVIYNSAVLINPEGEIQGIYSKVVTPLYLHPPLGQEEPVRFIEEAELFRQGNALPVFKTRIGNIGILICQDSMFGELVRVLALKGAEIVVQIFAHLTCYTGPSDEAEDDVLKCVTRAHARESGVYIVACNKCGVERFQHADGQFEILFQGESHIADPLGKLIALGKIQEPDLVVAELDTEFVKKARWTTKYWRDLRPELLTPLTQMSVTLGESG